MKNKFFILIFISLKCISLSWSQTPNLIEKQHPIQYTFLEIECYFTVGDYGRSGIKYIYYVGNDSTSVSVEKQTYLEYLKEMENLIAINIPIDKDLNLEYYNELIKHIGKNEMLEQVTLTVINADSFNTIFRFVKLKKIRKIKTLRVENISDEELNIPNNFFVLKNVEIIFGK